MLELTFTPELGLVLLKIVFVLGAIFYLIYSIVVARQIVVMKKTLITGFSKIITLLGYFNLTLAALTLLAFILFL